MRLKSVGMSVIAGMLMVSSLYADEGVGQGGSGQQGQGIEQQQSGQPGGDQGAGGTQGGIQSPDQQQQGSDLGGTSQQGGAMQGGMQDQASVKQVQEKLSQQGYDVGPVDGIFGPKTQQALRKFQEDKGGQPTGQIDQQTMAALGIQGQGGTQPGGAQPGDMGAGQPPDAGVPESQPGDMGAGQPQPDTGIEGSDQPGSDLGSGAPPDAGTQSPDAGGQGSEQQGSDAGALQQ